MDIIVTQEPGNVPVTVFHLKGGINLGNVDQLMQKAQEAIKGGARNLILDLAQVPSITSAGLRAILLVRKLINAEFTQTVVTFGDEKFRETQQPRHLVLLNPVPDVRNVLSVVGFDDSIGVYEDQQEALLAF
jgi:anti-anti-sigma factor